MFNGLYHDLVTSKFPRSPNPLHPQRLIWTTLPK